jgi:predicted phage terminase large subunit-like protein
MTHHHPLPVEQGNAEALRLRDELRPHTGPQEAFLSNPADICIGGGQAGGGKTFALLLEPLRHIHNPGFSAVIFRRTFRQLAASGGPWPESMGVYGPTGATPTYMKWKWPSGATVQFSHLQYEKDRLSWKGAQIALIGFDQLEDFTEQQFWYLLSRNRSISGVRPYVRATCNPVPGDDPTGGWLRQLLSWWIGNDGYPIPERAGKLRWFVRDGEALVWADTPEGLEDRYPFQTPRSLSFVPLRLEDNPTLQQLDPGYVSTLESLPYVERMRLRHGNWNVRAVAGAVFKRAWFKILAAPPTEYARRCRRWDCASTPGGGDYTAGVRVAVLGDGRIVIEDVVRGQWGPRDVDAVIRQTAMTDGPSVIIREEQEGGSSGRAVIETRARTLAGFDYAGVRSTGDKVTRWGPLRAQAEAGNVYVLNRPWAQAFIDECDRADGKLTHDDQVDAAASAYVDLARSHPPGIMRVPLAGFGR